MCPSTKSSLSSGTFSDKPIRRPCRLTHNTRSGEGQSLTRRSVGMKVLSVSKASSVDWQRRAAPRSQASGYDGSEGQSLRLLAHPSVMPSGQAWHRLSKVSSVYGPYKVGSSCLSAPADGADVSGVWGIPVIPRGHSQESIL